MVGPIKHCCPGILRAGPHVLSGRSPDNDVEGGGRGNFCLVFLKSSWGRGETEGGSGGDCAILGLHSGQLGVERCPWVPCLVKLHRASLSPVLSRQALS